MHHSMEITLVFLCLLVVSVHPAKEYTKYCTRSCDCRQHWINVKSGNYYPFITETCSCETSFADDKQGKTAQVPVDSTTLPPTTAPPNGLSSASILILVVGAIVLALCLIPVPLGVYFLNWQDNDRKLIRVYRGRKSETPSNNRGLVAEDIYDSDFEGLRMERFRSVVSHSPYLQQLRKMHQTCRPLQLA